MLRKTRWIAGGALALAVIGGGAGIAIATGGDDGRPLTGSDLDQAKAAALASTGNGSVIEAEVGDDGAAFSVDVRLDDGTVVEVRLDRDFTVIGTETDGDVAGEPSTEPSG